MDDQIFSGKIVWRPSPELMEHSNLHAFMRRHGMGSLEELQRRSTEDVGWFWDAMLRDLDIRFTTPYSKVVDLSRGMAWPRWCVDGAMNIVESCLDKYAGTPTDGRMAIRWEGEEDETRNAKHETRNGGSKNATQNSQYPIPHTLYPIPSDQTRNVKHETRNGGMTYAQLRAAVGRAANGLRSLGIGRGDVVAVCMPMVPEIVVAMLAIIKIGGIFLPLFSGYGVEAIAARLADADAKALFAADGCMRRGRVVPMKAVADQAVERVATVRHVIVLKRVGIDVQWTAGHDHWWHELIQGQADQAQTERTGAEDVMMLIYTSGTTGRPKGAVHTHCGFPIKAAQDMWLGLDLHPDEVHYWITDMGWMMGPWLVFGTLILGATMMLYDGVLDYPGPDRLWDLVQRHGVTTLGISPTLVRMLMRAGEEPVRRHDVSSLRKFGSTGEPWNPPSWNWLFEVVGQKKLPIINYSGGTEISGGILMGNVLTPMKPCAFCGPAPGMAADVVDAAGQSVRGAVGELVIRQPWIGMTRGFWKDPQRYVEAYWSRFENVWVHGDWAAVDEDGFWYILGRSDDTIKIAGKRLGPAEVESILVGHPAVSEAAAVGVPDALKGETLVCFCVLKSGFAGDEVLATDLRERVAAALGKAFMPQAVHFVADLPKTRNAKVMRRLVRAAYLGEALGDVSALENPGAVEGMRNAKHETRNGKKLNDEGEVRDAASPMGGDS